MARTALYDHQQPRIDLAVEALDALGPVDRLVVGDIGCGNGRYVDALRAAGARVIGVDLSFGMLVTVPASPPGLVAADAQSLPLRSASLDAVLMMHMLYHVPDPAIAIAESARVLRSDGRLLVGTNGPKHLAEMDALWMELLEIRRERNELDDVSLVNARFTAAEARQALSERFGAIQERWLRSSVVVTDAAPVVQHAASTAGARATGALRGKAIARFGRAIDEQVRRDGEFRITTEVALLTAAKA